MQLVHPEALLLVPLAWLCLRGALWPRPLVGGLRVALVVLAACWLAEPSWSGQGDGRTVVIAVDRSRSLPTDSLAGAQEFAAAVAAGAAAGDQVALLTFGRKPLVEVAPTAPFAWPTLRDVDADGSDLAAALAAAAALVPPGRRGSVLLWSDGLHTGGPLDPVVRDLQRQGLRVDGWHVAAPPGPDVAVLDVLVPTQIGRGEPFAATAVVAADTAGPLQWRLLVDGELQRQGTTTVPAGRSVLQLRHVLPEAGQHELAVEIERAGDPVPQNDRGLAVVRADLPTRILVVTPQGREDRLTRALRQAGFDVQVAAPAAAPLDARGLDACRAVVLEDVPAGDLPSGALAALATFVRDLGGGLLMTGGRASFGVGGYHQTPVEAVLPVTMEIREQQRRFGLALAIALDRSGSMTADAGGVTKMQLANRGAATAIELLSPIDALALLAVDTAAHVVVPITAVDDRAGLATRARTIESSGGGIFVGAALHAAAAELAKATQQHKHIVLFADAADAEEPDDYRTFVPQLVQAGVTVSVIGLGAVTDSDGPLLEEIAKLGNGRCQFVADANDLPRVFAQETIQVARSSVVEEPTAVAARSSLALLGDMPDRCPGVGGYSLAWPRPRAEVDLVTLDEQAAPLLAHWQCGLGRAAAYLGEVDGALSGAFATWDRHADFLATLVRWLGGGQGAGLFVEGRVEGAVGHWSLEVDAERAASLDAVRAMVTAPGGGSRELQFERVAPGRLVATLPLERPGVFRGALQVGNDTVRLPALCLPYSPEFAPRPDPRAGERTLRALARATGGSMMPTVEAVWSGSRAGADRVALGPALAWSLLALLLLEIAVRRLQWTLPTPRWVRRRARAAPVAAVALPVPAAAADPAAADPAAAAPATPAPAAPPAPAGTLDAIARAQQRARRR